MPGTSNKTVMLNQVAAQLAAQGGPILQFDQKKVPVFHGEADKDTLKVREWCERVDSMKATMGWTEAQTFHNAKQAMFGLAARQVTRWMSIWKDKEQTWAWLKKMVLKEWEDTTQTRKFIDALFSLRQRTNLNEDIRHHFGDVHDAFVLVEEALPKPDPQTVVANGGAYTDAQVNALIQQGREDVLHYISMAFMVNLMPPELRDKVLEAKTDNIPDMEEATRDAIRALKDKGRLVGALNAPKVVHSIEETQPAHLAQEMLQHLQGPIIDMIRKETQGRHQQNQGSGKGKGKGKNSNSYGNQNGSVDMNKKKCTYCQKLNHGQDECFSRIRDNAPCYNSKGEAYYPRNQNNKQVNNMGSNQRNNRGTNPQPSQPSTKASDQGFPGWV